jgi:hypothetical protein
VTPKEIRKIVRKHERRAKAGRLAKGLAVLGVLAGGAYAAWRWWDKQANPDWLVEPPAPTEIDEESVLASVDDEMAAKQAEADAADTTAAEAGTAEDETTDRDERP